MMENNLFSRQEAAEWLVRRLEGKSAEQWVVFLRDNANNARRAIYRLPVERIGRCSFYRLSELSKFVQFEKARRLGGLKLSGRAAEALQAFGVGQKDGGAYGRKWQGGSANLGLTNSGAHFVQTIINEPLTVFAMTSEQAIEFSRELSEAGQAAKRLSGKDGNEDDYQSSYTTITDNQDVIIRRRNKP